METELLYGKIQLWLALALVGTIFLIGGIFLLDYKRIKQDFDMKDDSVTPAVMTAVGLALAIFGFVMAGTGAVKYRHEKYLKIESMIRNDSGYTVYYNGDVASGSALGITEYDMGDYDITIDYDDKTIKIVHR